MGFQVAIDGPCGSGKSTVAKTVAKELGFIYIDTGAMYRAVGLFAMNKGVSFDDHEAIVRLLDGIDIKVSYVDFTQKIFLNGDDVTTVIRSQAVADASSRVAVINDVRKKLVEIQRSLAENNDVIMDGRDIGTHVLSNADVKIYLDASVEARSERRVYELKQLGFDPDINEIIREIRKRDYNDMNREHSPLRKANDAVVIDTSTMDVEAVKNAVIMQINKKR